MSEVSPTDYANRYHQLSVTDLQQSLNVSIDIRRYCSGSSSDRDTEMYALIGEVLKILKEQSLPKMFSFPSGDAMDIAEPFFRAGLVRAFLGKGSPAEIGDALRLAYRFKRVGPKTNYADLASYAANFMGIDCNAFIGNFYNLSPEIKPRLYALGTGGFDVSRQTDAWRMKNGFNDVVMLSLAYLPLKPRVEGKDIKSGDVLISVNGDAHEHIALVDDVQFTSEGLSLKIVEWGSAGAADVHIGKTHPVALANPPQRKYGACVAYASGFRYFFAPPESNFGPADWGRCGKMDN